MPEYLHPLSVAGIYTCHGVTERVQRNLDNVCLLRPLKSLSRSTIVHFLRVICAGTTLGTNPALVQVSTVVVQTDVCLGILMNSDYMCMSLVELFWQPRAGLLFIVLCYHT